MTVSKALRNAYGVAPATRERILAEAARLGYTQNPFVGSWMRHVRSGTKPETVALAFVTDSFAHELNHPVRRRVWEGANRRATELGYRLEIFDLGKEPLDSKRLTQILVTRDIRGVYLSLKRSEDDPPPLDLRKFAAVTWGYAYEPSTIHRSASFYEANVRLVCRDLTLRGWRRIALCLPWSVEHATHFAWMSGFVSYQLENHPDQKENFYRERDVDLPRFKTWLAEVQPDVVLGMKDASFMLKKCPARIRKRVDFFDLNQLEPSAQCAGVDPQFGKVGEQAVSILNDCLLLNRIGIPETPTVQLVIGKLRTPSPR